MKPNVLVVDDDLERSGLITRVLSDAFECRHVATLDEAFAALGQDEWDAALVDYDLNRGGSGLELLQALRDVAGQTLRILYSVYYNDGLIRDAARLAGAHAVVDARAPGFLVTVRGTLDELVRAQDSSAAPLIPRVPGEAARWIGSSASSREFLAMLQHAAESSSPAYLHGETGSGKTLAAALFRQWRAEWKASPAGRGPQRPGSSPVVLLAVPSLRDRYPDLPALVEHYLERLARDAGEPQKRLAPDVTESLLKREWRGNVRELHGVLLRASQRAGTRVEIATMDLPRDLTPPSRPSQYAKDEGQRECVLRQLRTARNVSGAARLEGISRTNYIRLMRRLGIIRADTALPGEGEDEA
jgi:DNA-binding NtrC family response regulator